MALKVSPSPKLFQNALLDQGESVWFGNLLMEQWPVLLTCGMWPVLDPANWRWWKRNNQVFKKSRKTDKHHANCMIYGTSWHEKTSFNSSGKNNRK